MDRAKELAKIKRSIPKIDAAFAPAIKSLAPCTFGLEKPTVTHYQSLIRSVIAQQVSDENEIKETAVPSEYKLIELAKIKDNKIEDKKGNGFGIASLSCALVGLRVPFFGILAVIFGAIGMNKNRSLRGLAIAGFSLGVLETVISFLALLLIIAFF